MGAHFFGDFFIFLFVFFFWSSRLPSLVFATKITHLLHFVAKISHSHCSSIFRLVSVFFQWFLSSFLQLFHGFLQFFYGFLQLFYGFFDIPWCSSIFQWFSSFFYVFLQFVHGVHSVFTCFHFWFQSCSLIFTWFSLFVIEVFIYFWKYAMCKLQIVDVERYICMTNHDYMYM